ncbi:hypothetical protein BH10PLA2_BH10PLA2_10770 [soil metagenome]
MAPVIKTAPSGKIQSSRSGNNITFSTVSGQPTTWPEVSLCLCNQNDASFPNAVPTSPPANTDFVVNEKRITVSGQAWSHQFTNVATGTYTLIAIKIDGSKQWTETDHINDVSVP